MADPVRPRRAAPAAPAAPLQPLLADDQPEQPEQPASRKASPQRGPTVYQLFGELKDWMITLGKSFASFSALNGALRTARGDKAADGERVRGMPVFEFPATVDGTDSVRCALDLARVRPEYQAHVLVPLAEMSAQDLLEAVEEIEERIAQIKPMLMQMTGASQ